jgi:light-regulated signal transduction histidine kinase (bacteriophytochrome)
MLQRIEARRLPNIKPGPNQNPTSFIATSSTDLLKLVDADFALVSIQDKIRAIGRMEPYHEALAIMSYLQSCRFTTVRSSQNIKADFPGLSYPAGVKVLAGLLLIPLNVGEENDFLVFFRKGQLRHVKWAGYVPDHSNLVEQTLAIIGVQYHRTEHFMLT